MNTNLYVITSLELHLFFSRIMKEHALFLRAGFTPANSGFSERAEYFLKEFESLLCEAVCLSDGVAGKEVLESGEVVTEFTALAERQTEQFTGLQINQEITEKARCLKARDCHSGSLGPLQGRVRHLNRRALRLLDGLIAFKESILRGVLQCELFTLNYPLLIEHILREARLYRRFVELLEREGEIPVRVMKETECFWNQIMMEHAQFIRGLLDPCETELYSAADDFAKEYCKLLDASRAAHSKTLTEESLSETIKFRDFKAAGTRSIQQCKIRSIILPLLADHVLREANHYIRLLQA